MNILFKNSRADAKQTRRGYVEMHLLDVGLVIRDVVVHVYPRAEGEPRVWVAMPARPYVDGAGKPNWSAFLIFDKSATEELQAAAREQLRLNVVAEEAAPA